MILCHMTSVTDTQVWNILLSASIIDLLYLKKKNIPVYPGVRVKFIRKFILCIVWLWKALTESDTGIKKFIRHDYLNDTRALWFRDWFKLKKKYLLLIIRHWNHNWRKWICFFLWSCSVTLETPTKTALPFSLRKQLLIETIPWDAGDSFVIFNYFLSRPRLVQS